jgi:plasmid maintenance system antidote protein VapI
VSKSNQVIKRWLKQVTPDEARKAAQIAKTSVAHLRHIAAGRRGMTAEMAQRVAHATGLKQKDLCAACAACPIAK